MTQFEIVATILLLIPLSITIGASYDLFWKRRDQTRRFLKLIITGKYEPKNEE